MRKVKFSRYYYNNFDHIIILLYILYYIKIFILNTPCRKEVEFTKENFI